MNIALGTYYAWSVFVPALEREFGWSRTQTSLVPTIDMVMVASMFLVAGFLQRRIGPRAIAAIGGVLFSRGLLLASWTQSLPMLYLTWGVMVGAGDRLWLSGADHRWLEMVSPPSRAGQRPRHRNFRRRLRPLRARWRAC